MANSITVRNPGGRIVQITEAQWPELEKQGFTKLSSTITNHAVTAGSPPPNDPNAADLNFVAAFQANNGMGRVGEEVLLSLDRLGLKVNIQPLFVQAEGLSARTIELLAKKYTPSKRTLIYSIPQVLENYHTEETYLHIPWDTTKAPDEWVELMNKYATKVFPCSHFTREVFLKSGVTVPMETIKHGVNPQKFIPMDRDWGGLFTFTTFGDISQRKGTDALVRAFQKAFPKRIKNVQLIIKSNHKMDWGKIDLPEDDDRIRVIDKPFNHLQLLELLKKTHVYVAPSRAEGFCLPALEAMATGCATIVHQATGLTIMSNDRYNFVIGSDGEMKAPAWHYPASYSEGGGIGNWVNPNEEELKDMMRFLFQQRDEAKKKGDKAAKWTKSNWGWDSQVSRMWDIIVGSDKPKTWGDFYNGDTLTVNNVQDSVNSHKEFFWLLKGFKPDKIIETGCGTGEMAGYLTWDKQSVEGKEPTTHKAKEVIAMDIEAKVIKIARTNLDAIGGNKAKLVKADAWTYEEKADLIFSQGLLEHFDDERLRALIDHQLEQAPVLIHSVPNNDYGKRDFGNERLMSDDEWNNIFAGYDMIIYRYWDEDGKKKQTNLIFNRKDVKRPRTSIIMPVWNHKDTTIKAIEAVRKNTKDYELIVIDNNSTDGIETWLEFQKDLRVIHLSQNVGVPKAKNLGMAMSKGEYICFLDNDTEVGEGWLEGFLGVFSEQGIGFTGHEGYEIDVQGHTFLGNKHVENFSPDWIPGSCFIFPRKFLRDTGMLLDRDLWCCEDVDFCLKMRSLGLQGKLPKTRIDIKHMGSETAKRFDFSAERFNAHAGFVWGKWRDLINTPVQGIRIDIGVGFAPAPGYLHVDIQDKPHVEVVADTRHLPFDNNSVAEVRNAHLIEHFTRMDIDEVLKEWIRVLKKGGTLRTICPDFMKICRQFVEGKITEEQALLWTYGGQLDKYDYHYWLYTKDSLAAKFGGLGLINIISQENKDGWLEVTGQKAEETVNVNTVKSDSKLTPKVGIYVTHVHGYGGGENCTFQTISMLKKLYPDLEVISSEPWKINPREFGIDLPPVLQATGNEHYDIFINLSHFELHKPLGDKNICYLFYPQYNWKEQLKEYQEVVTISEFSAKQIKKVWGIDAKVIAPATEISVFSPAPKEQLILCVGRFFKVSGGNNKNQEVLIDAFKKMPPGWKLVFVGTIQDQAYYDKLVEQAKGLNIEFRHNIPFSEITLLYSKAKYLWSATGFGAKEPSSQEHFGMVAVEAMAAGCQPIVFNGGGMAEIEGVITWEDITSLAIKTKAPTSPETLTMFAQTYSPDRVIKDWEKITKNASKQSNR